MKKFLSLFIILCIAIQVMPILSVSANEIYTEFDIGGFYGYDGKADIAIKGSSAKKTDQGKWGPTITIEGPCVLTLPGNVFEGLQQGKELVVFSDVPSWEAYINNWQKYYQSKNNKKMIGWYGSDGNWITENPDGIALEKDTHHCMYTSGGDGYFFTLIVNGKKEAPPISVYLNGKKIEFDQQPILENDRTLVPLRAIFEELGATVEWNDETETVTSKKDGIIITLTIGSNKLYVNDEVKILDVPAKVVNDRTLVPVRAVSESFNCKVDWDDVNQSVIITN